MEERGGQRGGCGAGHWPWCRTDHPCVPQALPYVCLLIAMLFFIYAIIGMQVRGRGARARAPAGRPLPWPSRGSDAAWTIGRAVQAPCEFKPWKDGSVDRATEAAGGCPSRWACPRVGAGGASVLVGGSAEGQPPAPSQEAPSKEEKLPGAGQASCSCQTGCVVQTAPLPENTLLVVGETM